MIPILCTENNTLVTDQKEILNEVKGFYFNLYEERDILDVDLNNLMNNVNIPKLNINQANELEGEITKLEIMNALKRMKNNKSPGSDGYMVRVFSSPEPKAQVSYCHSAPSIVRPASSSGVCKLFTFSTSSP